jgi:hypothetical protein
MASSVYDRNDDGRCDVAACQGVTAVVLDQGVVPEQARVIRGALADLGIELTLEVQPDGGFYSKVGDPRRQTPIGVGFAWFADFPEGGGWFPPLFATSPLDGRNPPSSAPPRLSWVSGATRPRRCRASMNGSRCASSARA